ncbi:MAG: hypothetical protein IPN59_12775, partial [Holophaga sp.]|nr:hypothetical protein [Holophaga sp.]
MRRTPLVTFLGLGLILIFSRFWMARSLAAPMWGDAVQHGVIAQLILDNQGLFSSWQPFAEYQTLSIHFGVSALSAGLVWLSGIETVRAVLWIGQIVNILAVLGLYPLALSLWDGDAWAGTLSVLIAGFVSSVPAIYLNWGRYAQLSGQAALMAVLWLVLASLKFWTRSDSLKRSQIGKNLLRLLAVGLGAAGMSLSYYRMPLFLGFFMAAWLAGWLVSSAVQGSRFDIGFFLRFWLAVGLLALVSAGSAGPWIPQMFSTRLFSYVQAGIDALASGSNALALLQKDYAVWLHPEYYYPPFVTGLA